MIRNLVAISYIMEAKARLLLEFIRPSSNWRAAILPTLIKINGRLHTLRFLMYGAAVNVTEQSVEDVTRYLLTCDHVEIAVIRLYVSEPIKPLALFQPSCFFLFDLTHTRCGLIRESIVRRYLVIHRRQTFSD